MFKKRKLEKLKNEIRLIISEYEKKSMVEDKYFLITSKSFKEILDNPNISFDSLDYLFNLYKGWDDKGSISIELGEYIEKLVDRDDIVLGIHRPNGLNNIANNSVEDNPFLKEVFNNGLKNFGDLSYGHISDEAPEPSKTVSPIVNMIHAEIFLKTSYKDSTGGILVALPSDCVDEKYDLKAGGEREIYYKHENTFTIKPEYLLGYVSQDKGNCVFYPKNSFQVKGNKK